MCASVHTASKSVKQTLTEIKDATVDFNMFPSVYDKTSQQINKEMEYLNIVGINSLSRVTYTEYCIQQLKTVSSQVDMKYLPSFCPYVGSSNSQQYQWLQIKSP